MKFSTLSRVVRDAGTSQIDLLFLLLLLSHLVLRGLVHFFEDGSAAEFLIQVGESLPLVLHLRDLHELRKLSDEILAHELAQHQQRLVREHEIDGL